MVVLKKIWYVIPCFNESEVISETARRLLELLNNLIFNLKISNDSRILFVDDGSIDDTWEKIKDIIEKDNHFCAIKLSSNRGHQNALMAGLTEAGKYADAVISMDADLQDDINASRDMIEHYLKGAEIVFGVRSSRKTDTFFKRHSAQNFYKLMTRLGTKTVYNHADYRLMSKKALQALSKYKEVNLFLRGIVPDLGFKSVVVTYKRGKRFAGKSKYPFKKMLSFAVEGITSFSIKPLKAAVLFGGGSFIISAIMLIYCIYQKIIGNTVPGWSSLGVSIWAVGGLQLLLIGIIGEYVGKIYIETKRRPRYIIDETINIES